MKLAVKSNRAGRVIAQTEGYQAFLPKTLPPDPPLEISGALAARLQDATLALGKLEGITEILPNPDLFLTMFVRKESLLSSQIEGTQATLEDVLDYELRRQKEPVGSPPAWEVSNYVKAMNYGLDRIVELPLSLRLIREVHQELMSGVRDGQIALTPGEFRTTQNWLGPAGCTLESATFVPPPPSELMAALGNLEMFMHDPVPLPLLIRCALVHAQFETIHPFLDGNGRVGRLLITLQLCQAKLLSRPLLYLSYFFKRNRDEYYESLNRVRSHGEWEEWVSYFLRGVAEVSDQASTTAKRILILHREHSELIRTHRPRGTANALALFDHLFQRPYLTPGEVTEAIGVSAPTANDLLRFLTRLGITVETTGRGRGRFYVYDVYMQLMREGTEL